ncbi:MAG TPA: winged helix-turn-helix domain-containing protein [Casimicrobiaceae bacterium]|nr:winged helix-turn-helix domain-containing protein [Casimicrobiaceae bacterium]
MDTPNLNPDFAPRRFGRFELRPGERVLLADGAPVTLGARAFDLLVAFADRPGTLITKDDLLATVWPGVVVEENNLQVQVSTLRKILGQSALATIPGRGYRFNLPVASAKADADTATVTGTEPTDGASDQGPPSRAHTNLPSRLPLLYGRAADVAAIVALLREHPVVTVTGSGGIGKTRVAQAVAKQILTEAATDYSDGVWWVELAALADGELVPSAVAEAMGLRIPGERPTALALRSQLAAQRILLVLDNCEHLADAVASLIDAVTSGAPHASVLVTSQETLKATDEHVYRISGLAVPADTDVEHASQSGAIELFAARAQAADPRFTLTATNLPAVVEVCRHLDGIPLAIELAAARLPLLGVEGLRARLHERFNLLTGGARVVLRRHQTLRATLEWSHALLTPDEQTVFRRLGGFAGGFSLEAAQHVASDEHIDPWTTLDHLGALVDKSLVLAEGDAVPRYRMLETTRAYALERLTEAGEMQATLRRHAHAMLALLEPLEQYEWRRPASAGIVPEAKVELDNVRAALEWADKANDGPLAVALASVTHSVWWSSSHMAEGLARCLAVRRHVDSGVSATIAARFWLTIAKLGLYSTRRESYDAAVRATTLYRDLKDDQRTFEALTFAAVQGTRFASVVEMGAELDEAAQLERQDWPARQRAKLAFARCFWFARQGRIDEALASAHQQVAICREGGVELAALYAMSNVTLMEVLLGRWQEALDQSRACIARLYELGADTGAGHLYHSEMLALLMLDRSDEALAAARNAYPRLVHEGDQYRLLLPLALINALAGRLEAAARIIGFDGAAQTRSGENASIVAEELHGRLDPLLAARLSADDRQRLAAEGAAMHEVDAFSLALSGGIT